MVVKERISRIPWREYLSEQLKKILGIGLITLLLVITMTFSIDLNLDNLFTIDFSDTDYLIVILFSSIAYLFVLIGFTKIIIFDMAEEFGLRDEAGNMVYNLRFWFFAILVVSFCSAAFILLEVLIEEPTYLVILPVLLTRAGLELFAIDLQVGDTGPEFYTDIRNFYFDIFYLIILGFSIIVFLSILTTLARRRIIKRFRKEKRLNA